MPNKPHAPRQGTKSSKKPANTAAAANGEDTYYIVFGKDTGPDKKPKAPKPTPPNATSTALKSKQDGANTSTQPEPEKKPDTRTLIAGSSWTGKLPMTLFNEYCQKQKWEKPEYIVSRSGKGFAGSVILRQKNPKTHEFTELPLIRPPKEYVTDHGTQDTAIEARHFAATYALFRVGNMQNRAMALPPQYRDLWKGDFAQLKNDAVAEGQGHLYEADPFLAKKRHDEAKVAKDKARADGVKRREEAEKQRVTSLDGPNKQVERGWKRVPKVEMGAKTRREVERLVRADATWSSHEGHIEGKNLKAVVDELRTLGFRPSHIEEAAEVCRDTEECLEWLLIHLPEDDVPQWALPENYLAGIALASGDVQRDYKLQRLSAAGYSRDVCSDALDAAGGDENAAAATLQSWLLSGHQSKRPIEPADLQQKSETWEEELATLEAIYSDRFTKKDGSCSIVLETSISKKVILRARSPGHTYPSIVPIISVETDLPAYIKLSILRRCLVHANDNFLGVQMLFNILDWLEREIPSIVDHPDRLSELTGAASSAAPPSPRLTHARTRTSRHPKPLSWQPNTPISQRILQDWRSKQSTPEQQKMNQARQGLPAWKLQDAIVAAVNANQVTIISGETGSGKSTQSVQFVLDDLIKRGFGEQAHIICTQPRRISALGLADRVSEERCGQVGAEVGYAIRGETKQRQGITKLQFVTTGVLLRRLQTSGGTAQDVVRSLADVTHVFIDEVHERSLDTDFLLVLLRDVLKLRRDLKLILMSATLDASTFEQYFRGAGGVSLIEIEGRTHPVQDIYADEIARFVGFSNQELGIDSDSEDDRNADMAGDFRMTGGPRSHARKPVSKQWRINYQLIAQTVQHIDLQLGDTEGGILIFLPGVGEIDQALRALRDIPNLHALPLHAGLQSAEQRRVFPRPPKGLRKVIAATNVAETSITIEDIVAVIDTGRVKETAYDPSNNMVRLAEVWASRAACKQRRGRAGRVRAGKCYKLYTRNQETKMAERPEPEIRRVPLEQLCLSVKAMGTDDVPRFLASALTPPESLAVTGAIKTLERIGALDRNELTALGKHLSMIPADLKLGKLLVYGAAFGCLDACLTVAATLSVKSPFVSPQPKRAEAKAAKASFGHGHGDLICELRAFEEWSSRRSKGEPTGSLRRWCEDNFLSWHTLMDINSNRNQYLSSLREIGFVAFGAPARNVHGDSDGLLRALIAGSFQPQVARIDFPDQKFIASAGGAVAQDPEAHTIKYFNEENGRVFVHPSSTVFDAHGFPGQSVYMSYFSKMATSKVFINGLTPFNGYSLLMFGGAIAINPQARGLLVDGWLRLKGWARIGVLVSRLRKRLDDLLGRKIDDPAFDMAESDVVRVVRRIVEFDGLDH